MKADCVKIMTEFGFMRDKIEEKNVRALKKRQWQGLTQHEHLTGHQHNWEQEGCENDVLWLSL
jgi:hypothetical protein